MLTELAINPFFFHCHLENRVRTVFSFLINDYLEGLCVGEESWEILKVVYFSKGKEQCFQARLQQRDLNLQQLEYKSRFNRSVSREELMLLSF